MNGVTIRPAQAGDRNAINEVEAKNAAPFCRDAVTWPSTMRMLRPSISSIQRSRYACISEFRLSAPCAVRSTTIE